MGAIENLVEGSQKLTAIFGYWPSFHDAQILDVHLWRGKIDRDKQIYQFPFLKLTMLLHKLTNEVDPTGHLVLTHHTHATIRFDGITGLRLQNFDHQNMITSLSIEVRELAKRNRPTFYVEIENGTDGMTASFECHDIEVVDASQCRSDGEPL